MAKNTIAADLKRAHLAMRTTVQNSLITTLTLMCDDVFRDMAQNKEYTGFTGNTQTSYTCGLYINSKLVYYVNQYTWNRKPVRKKVPKGVYVYLEKPYEGHARNVYGEVGVDNRYGADTALAFLKSYSAPKNTIALVATTGTEYSEYIESVLGLNVMTDTWQKIASILKRNIKPVK